MSYTLRLVATAVLIAIGVLLPIVFHMAGAMGSVFLPMHIPVLITGLFLGPRSGAIAGMITPLLSSLVTGMPPILPIAPIMSVELAAYGAISGYLYHRRQFSLLVSLVGAMIGGRLLATGAVAIMVELIHIKITPLAYLSGAVLTGFPGMVIQLILIPQLVKRLCIKMKNKQLG